MLRWCCAILRRSAFEAYMAKLAPTEVALEACGGARNWARRLMAMGHRVRLIPPQYVKAYVKRSKPTAPTQRQSAKPQAVLPCCSFRSRALSGRASSWCRASASCW